MTKIIEEGLSSIRGSSTSSLGEFTRRSSHPRQRCDPDKSRSYLLQNLYDTLPAPRIGATTSRAPSVNNLVDISSYEPQFVPLKPIIVTWWTKASRCTTFYCCSSCLGLLGKKGPLVQQAWREKMTLCLIIFCMTCVLVAYTLASSMVSCDSMTSYYYYNGNEVNWRDEVTIRGFAYHFDDAKRHLTQFKIGLTADWKGRDISTLFSRGSYCSLLMTDTKDSCFVLNHLPNSPSLVSNCLSLNDFSSIPSGKILFTWEDMKRHQGLVVFNNQVLNISNYRLERGKFNETRSFEQLIESNLGTDVTLSLSNSEEKLSAMRCLIERYRVGFIESPTLGCTLKNISMTLIIIVIWGVIIIRICMAILYQCCFSHRLIKKTKKKDDLVIVLMTCYSESRKVLKSNLNSIAATKYSDKKKLIVVIADGLITGSGNTKSTPDILLGLIKQDSSLDSFPKSYIAIAEGAQQHNLARVHAGTYEYKKHKVPILAIIKCGTSAERDDRKPGNRGKRDSQLILLNVLSRVMFDDRMTPLDYDICHKVKKVSGLSLEQFDFVLMVDADTLIHRNSIDYMIRAMNNDPSIMGLCGETRVRNKFASWVSMIQVFEYFLSHHLQKSFESLFGAVTCLPGCFCMYRLKAYQSSGRFVPLLVSPDIIEEYAENSVQTLHEKNLLLLGEDRFLTTLMLRQFPKRKLVFVPQALCNTDVPEKFSVLLSQRRRWINSTIHNLLELVKLKTLCGVFCFSMPFVIALDLIGTVLLPGALGLFIYYIITASIHGAIDLQGLVIVLGTLGLPGTLIVVLTGNFLYIFWMIFYLLALPVWNFVLPLYAFAKFDDFSWGQTRKLKGGKQKGGAEAMGSFLIGSVPLKRFSQWEEERQLIDNSKEKKEDITDPEPIRKPFMIELRQGMRGPRDPNF